MTAWAGRSNKGEGVTIESLSLGLAGETKLIYNTERVKFTQATRQ